MSDEGIMRLKQIEEDAKEWVETQAELETLKAENERLKVYKDIKRQDIAEFEKLTEQNRIMKKALEFYAREEEFCESKNDKPYTSVQFIYDGNPKAKEALAKCKELETT